MKEKLDILSYRYLKEFEAALEGITVGIDSSGRDIEIAVDKSLNSHRENKDK